RDDLVTEFRGVLFRSKVALVARRQHSKDGEWGNGVVFSVAALGLVVLASLHYVFSNRLDEGAWDRLATSAASITPAIASAHANQIGRASCRASAQSTP